MTSEPSRMPITTCQSVHHLHVCISMPHDVLLEKKLSLDNHSCWRTIVLLLFKIKTHVQGDSEILVLQVGLGKITVVIMRDNWPMAKACGALERR
ncbi:hypothetical protein HN011_000908 [Eciton burchellii]|nr:hypothetical protein HN011_000908 [Eciton burchellii]